MLESDLAGLEIRDSAHPPAAQGFSLPKSTSTKKRRLATTRGFGGGSYTNTPDNSPTRFNPEFRSTPVPPPFPSSSRRLPPHPPLSPSDIHLNPFLNLSLSDQGAAGLRPSVIAPRQGAGLRPTVISPRITVEQPSLDWDNYSDSPSYRPSLGTDAQNLRVADCLREVQGITGLEDIQKVTLVDTSVSSLSSPGGAPFQPSPQQTFIAMSQEQSRDARVLENMKLCIEEMLEDFTADDVREGNIDEAPNILGEISKARLNFRNAAREYKQTYVVSGTDSAVEWLDSSIATLNQDIKTHAHSIWARMEVVKAGLRSASVQVPAGPAAATVPPPSSQSHDDLEYKRKLYRDNFLFLTESLSLPDEDDQSVSDYWGEQVESEVCSAMQKLSDWQKGVEKLSKAFREYERAVSKFGDPGSAAFQSDSEDFETLRIKVKEVTIAVKVEDQKRNLQTLMPQKSEKVKYPTFSGDVGEDMVKFKKKIIECFRKNRIPESDMLDKLRENLKGAALKRVPETVKEISVAWSNLQEAFGSPMIVLRERLKSLNKLGNVPPDTSASRQISWYHDFESVIQDIIDLGSGADMNLQMGAFGPPVQEMILKALADDPLKKREVAKAGYGKQPEEKVTAFRDKIVEYRRDAQLAEVESGGTVTDSQKKGSKPPSAAVTTPDPIKNEECRICNQLEVQGNQQYTLFDNHLGKYTNQCPNFMKMSMKERVIIIKKIKMCCYCLDYKVVTDRAHETECKDKNYKNSHLWKCSSPGCGRHSWVCTTHADNANKTKLSDYAKRLSRRGLQFTNIGIISLVANSNESAAFQELEKQVSKELIPTPNGQPIFLFFSAKGRTRSLKIFFDSGCSKFIMRDCIPNQELPASLVRAGRFPIGGVGGCVVFAENEYMVAMDTVDGKAQELQGVTVKSITSDFPELDITAAAAEVMSAAPQNLQLRRCKFPRTVGGKIDCLIGIQYNQLQPVLLHMLPSGLAIYKTKLAPHIPGHKFVLGGPHSSFDAMLATVGDADHMMEQFIAGLASWRSLGPPSLTKHIMSEQEVMHAMEKNLLDDDMGDFRDLVELEQSELHEQDLSNIAEFADIQPGQEFQFPEAVCFSCGEELSMEYIAGYQDEEKLSRLKQIIDHQDSGIDISYRCIRCRNCSDCKNAEKIDKISLREESELFEIKNSYQFDWEHGVIMCTLPLRGRERDFLSSNEQRAMKVLDSQCRKYFKDQEVKETVLAGFQKLIDKGYIMFIDEMTEEMKNKFMDKEVQYVLPWRIQFKPGSASTPARPVFDASSGTRRRQDGSGGRCLNDLVCKGPIDTLDLLKVVLGFLIGNVAYSADLSKMYNQFKLVPEQWNLQRLLLRDDLNPEAPVRHAVVSTLIYGVKSSSGQSEHALEDMADIVNDEKPLAAKVLKHKRYVDNFLDSTTTLKEAKEAAGEAEEVLARVGIFTKGVSYSGEDPQPQETIDGVSIEINAMKWYTKLDMIEPKVPPLHFGNSCRGRLVNVEFFESGGDFAKMDSFVPKKLSRRMIVSKRAALYDSTGKFEPIKAKLKLDERAVVRLTKDWDDPVPSDIRTKWLRNFLLIEQLRGMRFSRARMPSTAIDTRMRLITLVDAAEEIIMVVTYCGFRVQDGGWSAQQLIGRSVLGTETIPRNELQALNGGSNLAWIVRKALPDWVESSIIAGDSEIALKWTTYDSRKLGMWVRNRIIQIRRGTELSELYHVGSEHNVADVGTRADKVTIGDVGPDSRYENGDEWMRMEMEEAVTKGFIRPALEMMTVPVEKEDDFRKEFLIDKEPEVLTRGHAAADLEDEDNKRVSKIAERATFSNYGRLLPTRRSFPAMVRIAGYVIAFIDKCRLRVNRRKGMDIKWAGQLLVEAGLWFSAFPTRHLTDEGMVNHVMVITVHETPFQTQEGELFGVFSVNMTGKYLDKFSKVHACPASDSEGAKISDKYLNAALLYFFRQASSEVLEFNSSQVVNRKSIMKDGVLLSRGRILDGMNFIETADLDTLHLGSLGIKTMIPVIDRFSPLAYSLGQHFHWTVAKHRGFETCLRISLQHVHILQGMSLFRELADECFRCKMKRGKFIKASLGPLSQKQLFIAPAFYACQVDLFGPLRSFVPGFEKETRAVKAKQSKIWIFVAVCLVTSNVNLQVCEMKDTCSMLEAFIRLACECGYPKYVSIDQESSIMAALNEIKVDLRDLEHRLYSEHGMIFDMCPVGGHDAHGKVERTIKSVQESFEDIGLSKMRLPAMGVQTLCKQVENAFNNLPLGFRYDRSHDNTEVLRMLVPNMLRLGRINSRALDGPVRLSSNNRKMLGEIQEKYAAWYKVWCEVYIPKLMAQKQGFKNSRDLQVDDLVYFQKKESELASPWIMGKVDQVVRGRDGVIRRVILKYRNHSENEDRVTDRSVRKLIKLYSADDPDLQVDLGRVQARIEELQGLALENCGDANALPVYIAANNLVLQEGAVSCDVLQLCHPVPAPDLRCQCCCQPHCDVSVHNLYGSKTFTQPLDGVAACQLEAVFNNKVEQVGAEAVPVELEADNLTALIMSVQRSMD